MKKKSKEAQRKFRALSQKCNILLFSFEEKFCLIPTQQQLETLHFQNGTRHLRSVAILTQNPARPKKKRFRESKVRTLLRFLCKRTEYITITVSFFCRASQKKKSSGDMQIRSKTLSTFAMSFWQSVGVFRFVSHLFIKMRKGGRKISMTKLISFHTQK